MRLFLISCACFLLSACELPWVVEAEYELTDVPLAYGEWFREVAQCMDRPSSATSFRFARIEWHAGTGIYNPSERRTAWGLWTEPHKITIREDKLFEERVIKHEIVHDLLGRGSHDGPYFLRCAGI